MTFSYQQLKDRHRSERDINSYSYNLTMRVHRALSWLDRAEREETDQDARFIFLWIAFNAAYANELSNRQTYSEKKLFILFLKRLIDADKQQLLYNIIWKEFPNSVRALINNKYVFQPFWDFHNGDEMASNWEEAFSRSKVRANKAIGEIDTLKALAVVFDRLYVLRNQLLHGGATWNSQANRDQIKNGADIMGKIVPAVINLMMDNYQLIWGDPCYPVVD